MYLKYCFIYCQVSPFLKCILSLCECLYTYSLFLSVNSSSSILLQCISPKLLSCRIDISFKRVSSSTARKVATIVLMVVVDSNKSENKKLRLLLMYIRMNSIRSETVTCSAWICPSSIRSAKRLNT